MKRNNEQLWNSVGGGGNVLGREYWVTSAGGICDFGITGRSLKLKGGQRNEASKARGLDSAICLL